MMRLTVTLTLLCNLTLGAHFLREGSPIAMLLTLAASGLLFVRRPSTILMNQFALVGGAVLWLGTAGEILSKRMGEGKPYVRMLAILCAVAALSLTTAVLWALPKVRRAWLRLPEPGVQA
jgi:hypothetical protein